MKEDCPKRMVNCRTRACNARFPFCDRELHEKNECAYRLVRCTHIYVPSTTQFDDSELNPENGEDIMIRKRSISRNVSKLEESETIIRKKQKIPKDAVSIHHMKNGGTEEKKVRIKGCGELVRLSNMEEHWKMNAQSGQYRVDKVVEKLSCCAILPTTRRTAALNDKLCVL